MIIFHEGSKVPVQASLVEDDHVIEALAANGSDHAFHVCALPRRPRRREHLLDAHRIHLLDEVVAEDSIAIPEQVPWRGVPWEGFAHLLRRPSAVKCAVTAKCTMR